MSGEESDTNKSEWEDFKAFLKEKEEKDRFIRWQKTANDQLGYAMNLILTLSVASLGFALSLLRDSNFSPGCTARCTLLFAFLTLGLSAACGVFGTITRVRDFRGTARRASSRPDKPSKSYLDDLGRLTWAFFYSELLTFLLGAVLLALTLLLTYGNKVI